MATPSVNETPTNVKSHSPSMTILCLDLGTTTGWAVQSDIITSGTQCFKSGRFEGGGMRFLKFKQWLTSMQYMLNPLGAVYFEEVRRHKGTDAAHVYGGFLAHLTAWCDEQNIPYEGIPVGTIKKHATGKGNAGKEAIIQAMKRLNHNPVDDNEADALALLHHIVDTRFVGAS